MKLHPNPITITETHPPPVPSSSHMNAKHPPPPPENTHPMKNLSKTNIIKAKTKQSHIVTTTKPTIPKTLAEALRDRKWHQAMCDEINALIRNGTYDLVDPEDTQNIVGCKWVFRIKYLPNGEIDRYKARFVAKGFH